MSGWKNPGMKHLAHLLLGKAVLPFLMDKGLDVKTKHHTRSFELSSPIATVSDAVFSTHTPWSLLLRLKRRIYLSSFKKGPSTQACLS